MALIGSFTSPSASVTNALGYTPVNKSGDSMSGALALQSVLVNSGAKQIRQWVGGTGGNIANGATVDLFSNTTQYVDVHFILIGQGYHSYRSWVMLSGSIGGYGLTATKTGSQADAQGFSVYYSSDGYGRLRFTNNSSYVGTFTWSAIILGDSAVTAHTGTLYA